MSKDYDYRCFELADYFTEDQPIALFTHERVETLAQVIQDAIDNYITNVKHDADAAVETAKDEAVDRAIDERQLGEDI